MDKQYKKSVSAYHQTLRTEINSRPETVFEYLGTTKGISQWFPELSFKETDNGLKLLFDLGDGTFEEMDVLIYEPSSRIKFTWDIGEVDITLKENNDQTIFTLQEKMPLEFERTADDFTGWRFQVGNVKHLIEEGYTQPFDRDQIKIEEQKLQEKLNSI
ncbi:hypothetical protein [Corticicoccus populi]|uniref:SRPBCC family protein n=1 Tax=Corticicoccus populi TaxID=1812821 RepID=A0ABW5WRT2_9STAP